MGKSAIFVPMLSLSHFSILYVQTDSTIPMCQAVLKPEAFMENAISSLCSRWFLQNRVGEDLKGVSLSYFL